MESKILIIRTIFCPNSKYCDITIKNLVNLFESLKSVRGYDMIVHICGWSNGFKARINSIIDVYSSLYKINVEYWQVNYGKYKMLNEVVLKNSEKYEYIFYSDHDIYFPNGVVELLTAAVNIFRRETNYKIGLVAPNYLGDNRHQGTVLNSNELFGELKKQYDMTSFGLGCYIAIAKYFGSEKLEYVSVYGLDDYYLSKRLFDNGYLCVVMENIYVEHPYDDNKEYDEWKVNIVNKLITKKNIFGSSLEDSINFWNSN